MIRSRLMIGATPRSGTTILQQVLAAHPAVVSPPETHFFIEIDTDKELLGPGVKPAAIYKRFQKHSHLDFFTELLTEKDFQSIQNKSDSREEFFKFLMDRLAKNAEVTAWVEKTPHHLRRFPLLLENLPEIKTLVIVRDPRDVCASMLNIRFASDTVEDLADRWLSENIFAEQCRIKYPDQVKLIRYRDLVYETEPIVKELCNFARIKFRESQLHPESVAEELVTIQGEHWKERNFRPITDESIGRYEEDLSTEEIKLVEKITGPISNKLLETEFETNTKYEKRATKINEKFKQALKKS